MVSDLPTFLRLGRRPREWVMPQLELRAFSSPVQVEAGHRGDDDEPRTNTAVLSTFQLEPEREISPPETKKPLGHKRRQTAARGSSDCTPSVPQPSAEEQAGPSSTYPLPHMNLGKMEYMKMDAWPAASQNAHFVEPVATVPLHCLDGLISGFGLPPVDYTNGVAVFVRTSLPLWKRLMRRWRRYVGKDVARGQRITEFAAFPMHWPKLEESPTRRDNGDAANDFHDGLPLPLEELDSCSAHAPTEPDPSAPTDQGDI